MNLTVVSFAKGRTGYESAEAEYAKRLSRHAKVAVEVIPRWDDVTGLPERLVKPGCWPVGLYIDGKAFTSEALAQHVDGLLRGGQSHLVFAIGGADGLPRGVDGQVRERWSLSGLTFSHGLARLLLLEVLYRSFDLLRGGNYHR